MKLETDINKCINLIKSEDIHLIDVEGMTRNFKENPSLGDLLQYELHIYCKKNMKIDSNVNFVVKLAEVCYSKHLVAHFTRMDRFVGCVYYICSYLLKNVSVVIQ